MKRGGYEAHMTFDREHAKAIEAFAVNLAAGWVYSVITGCPLLGQGTYCYLTGYSRDSRALKDDMAVLEHTLAMSGIPTLRSKIEHIVFDSKTGVDELG